MAATPNLILPYILAAQAQKHVTHNEAVRMLDALVQLAVADRSLSAPPASPTDGARYIVAASPTGAWSGHATHIAAYQDGAWMFYPPQSGWLAWVADEMLLVAWDGSAWVLAASAGGGGIANVVEDTTPQLGGQLDVNGFALGDGSLELVKFIETASAVNEISIKNAATGTGPTVSATGDDTNIPLNLAGKGTGDVKAPLLGVNATADATNRLAVASAASLFNHAGAGHQAKINKNAAGDTASFLFQTGFSGRAEMGTTGDDDFHFKVSPDGSAWFEAMKIDRSNGRVSFPSGGVRERLTANRTYYVRTDGSDSNTGLANTAGGAFLTIQAAVNAVALLDIAGFTATIQIADGTYTGAVVLKNVVGFSAADNLVIQGNNSTPANVLISTTSADAFSATGLYSVWDIKDLKIQTTTSGSALNSLGGSLIRFGNIDFGSCAFAHLSARGGRIEALSNYAVSGGANYHWFATALGFVDTKSRTITYSNSPNFAAQHAIAGDNGVVFIQSMTFTNGATVTGTRYIAVRLGNIYVGGGGANYIPGNAAGSTATGGQYN